LLKFAAAQQTCPSEVAPAFGGLIHALAIWSAASAFRSDLRLDVAGCPRFGFTPGDFDFGFVSFVA